MFGLFKRKTGNDRLLADAVVEVRRQAGESIDGVAALFLDTVFEGVSRALKENRERTEQALGDITALHLVTMLARNHSYQELQTGRHMIYRGLPSMAGEGYLAVFCWGSDRMVHFGDLKPEQARQEQADVREMLKSLG